MYIILSKNLTEKIDGLIKYLNSLIWQNIK